MFTKVIPVTGDRIQADLLRNQCLWLKDGHGWPWMACDLENSGGK